MAVGSRAGGGLSCCRVERAGLAGAACFGATVAILTRFLLRHCKPYSALIATVLGGALVLGHLSSDPTSSRCLCWSGALLAARDAAEVAPARLLPLMTLWANLHGSFMFGLALALFLGGEAVLRLGPRLRKARR
jgi:hypothetical protein